MLAGILRHFFTLDTSLAVVPAAEGEQDGEVKSSFPLEVRMARHEQYIRQLPRNVEDRDRLVECGYSDKLWDQVSDMSEVMMFVMVKGYLLARFFLSGAVSIGEDRRLSQLGGEYEAKPIGLLH